MARCEELKMVQIVALAFYILGSLCFLAGSLITLWALIRK